MEPPPPAEHGGMTEAFLVQAAEAQAVEDPRYPIESSPTECMRSEFVLNAADKSILLDSAGLPITIDRLLSTKPLRSDLHTRKGPGGRNLVYYNGETVSRLLNEVFGYDGWNMAVLKTEKICCSQTDGKYSVGFMAHVRITHRSSGTFKEDMGSGDAIDRSLPTAVQNAVKGAITDAMKRAARHFGEKLGNSLYSEGFSLNACPKTVTEALEQYDKSMTNRWGTAMQSKDYSNIKKASPSNHHSNHHPQVSPQIRLPLQQQTNASLPPITKQTTPPPPPLHSLNPSNASVVSDTSSAKNVSAVSAAKVSSDDTSTATKVPIASVPPVAHNSEPLKRPESSYGRRPTSHQHVHAQPHWKKPKLNPYS